LINVFVASPLLVNSQYQCPGGSFGRYERTSDVNSCEECRAGYYCPSYPNGPTTEDTMMPCGESFLYCPPGSAFPRGIDVGYYGISPGYEGADESDDTMMNRVAQVICPPGHYCEAGFRYKCRPGTYGEVEGKLLSFRAPLHIVGISFVSLKYRLSFRYIKRIGRQTMQWSLPLRILLSRTNNPSTTM
jgi:hypothetical protein